VIKPTWNYGPPEPYRQQDPQWNAKWIEALREIELLPPVEFDREYTGILTIKRGTQDDVRAMCPQAGPERPALGCAIRMLNGDTCTVIIANDVILQAHGWTYELALRHERSHCNRWRHSEKFR
jgi:hypothetical protein